MGWDASFQRAALVHRDVVGFVALDFILWLILARVVGVPFIVDVLGVHLDDRSADVPSLRVPDHVIADFKWSPHASLAAIAFSNATSARRLSKFESGTAAARSGPPSVIAVS